MVREWTPARGRSAPPAGVEVIVADVVVCVHDALDDVRRCLASVVARTDPRHRLILVDDASGRECRDELRRFVATHPRTTLLRNDKRLGYTRSANRGLRQSDAPVVVLLNSDTIVTPGWLERLLECAAGDPRIGIVGPLSNAATFQSVPERFDAVGGWALNPLPPGWGPDEVAAAVATIAPRAFPRVALVNGFCFLIKRAVIEAIGLFDEIGFPDGYGEEQDYCLRALAAGFEPAIADHAYVYHAWTRSYDPARRDALKRTSGEMLLRKHGGRVLRRGVGALYDEPTLAAMRAGIAHVLRETSSPTCGDRLGPAAVPVGV